MKWLAIVGGFLILGIILEGIMKSRHWKKAVIWLIGLDVVVFIGGSLIMAAYTVVQG